MTRSTYTGGTALAALLLAAPALADVTPAQVWQNWQDMSTSYGQTLTAENESTSGSDLVITGMTILSEQEGIRVEARIEEVVFADQGDGTVRITMSDSYPMTVITDAPPPPEGAPAPATPPGPTTVTLTIAQPGLEVIAAGGADESRYDFTAPSLRVTVDEVEGVDAEAVDLTVDVSFNAMTGGYLVSGTDTKTLEGTFAADSMAMVISAVDPAGTATFSMNASVADLTGTSTGSVVGMMDMTNMAAALNSGFASRGSFSYGATKFDLDATDETGMTTNVAAAADSGSVTVAMDKAGLAYGVGGTGTTVTVSGSQIPFPEVTMAFAESAFNLLMPVTKSDVPQDFQLLTRLRDLTISEDIWALIDPEATLPRDPATLVIDARGKAQLAYDLMDPANAEAMAAPGAVPGQIHALDVTELRLSLAGAELTGQGAFTFDNTDTTTFPGVPAPTGTMDMKLTGGNTLLDKLVALGLVPEEQAMGARMMLGLFARPGEGEDTLTSTLEFKDKGFYANGQRLQ